MKGEHRILWGGLAAGVLVWLVDTLVDYVFFNPEHHTYGQTITHMEPHEVIMRSMVAALFAALGVAVARKYAQKRRSMESARRGALRLATTLQSIGDGVIVTNADGYITLMNRAARDMTGWGPDATGRHLREVAHLHDETTRQRLPGLLPQVLSTRQVAQLPRGAILISRDGQERYVTETAAPILTPEGQITGIVVALHDMTQARAQQRVLDEERALASAVLDTVGVLIAVMDTQARIVRFNRALEQLTGYRANEVVGRNLLDLVLDQTGKEAASRIFRDITPGIVIHQDGYLFDRQGRRHIVHWAVTALAGPEGRAKYIIGCGEDVTERHEAENALMESRRQVTTLMSNLPGMVYRCRNDEHWTMEFVSDGCLPLTGYAPEDLISNRRTSFEKVIHSDDRIAVRSKVQSALEQKRAFTMAYRIVTPDGQTKWVWEQGRGVYAPDGRLLAMEGFIADVTERKNVEEQFRQAQKMEAVGQLAGGIAHDFNNQLTVIRGYMDLILSTLEAGDPLRDPLERVSAAADRAASLTGQLLAFSRKQILRPEIVRLNPLIEEMVRSLGRLIGEDIELVTHLQADLWPVQVDPVQAQQAMMNICINSRDAMPRGGRLMVETRNVTLSDDDIQRHGEGQAGPHVCVAISDTGIGMDAQTLARAFDPFFTTKPAGKGTGLGLAMVYGFVKQTGGTIYAYSEPGRGTTLKIYLPRAVEQVEAAAPAPARKARPRGHETVLVVEDDAAVRNLVVNVLRGCDYQVLDASNAEEAFERVQAWGGTIHLLLSDVVMPGMSGPDLARRLQERLGDLRVVFMTGYTENAAVLHGLEEVRGQMLTKPFSPDLLAQTIRDVLDRPAEAEPEPAAAAGPEDA